MYLSFGIFTLLNHSSAGDSDFSHKPIVLIFWSSVGVTPELMKLWLIFFKNSIGWIMSSSVPKNSMMFTCWLIVGNRSGGGFSSNGGRGLDHIGGMIDSAGLSDIDSISDSVTDDCDNKESDDAVRMTWLL